MKNKEADTELESRLLEILVHPCRIEDIRRELPNAGKNNLKNALDALVADGRVMKNKKNRFAVSAHYGCAAGTYLATERAFAFVAPDYPEGEAKPDDLFIPPNASGGAWHGDRVLVKVSERKNNRPQGSNRYPRAGTRRQGADRRTRAARQGIFRAADLKKVSGDCGGQA